MRYKKRFSLLILLIVVSMTTLSCQSKFDREIWLAHADFDNTENPRMEMTDDLLKNYLKKGMTKSEVIELLGKPFSDGIEYRLPKDIKIPDSVNIRKNLDKPKDDIDKMFSSYNKWYHANTQPDTLVTYYIAMFIDVSFLVIKLDNQDKAVDFWVESN